MKEPDNLTLKLLREIREEMRALDAKFDAKFDRLSADLRGLKRYMVGESIMARYTVFGVDERLSALETRLDTLERKT